MYENYVVPLQRRARKSRQATKGVGLHKTTQSMGTRIPISVVKGNRRPHDLVQATKFALEAGIVVGHKVPILTHWKQYKRQRPDAIYCTRFVDRLNVCMSIPC